MANVEYWTAWFVSIPRQGELQEYVGNDASYIKQLPTDGCLGIIIQHDDGTNQALVGYDYYFTADGNEGKPIIGCANETRETEVVKDIKARYTNPYIIRGVWTDSDTIDEIKEKVRGYIRR